VPVLIQIVTKLLAMAGAFLVTHGLMTDDQLNSAAPALAQEIVGLVLAVGATWYAGYRSKRNNDQKKAIVQSPQTFVPASIAVVTDKEGSVVPSGALAIPVLFLLIALPAAAMLSACASLGNDVRLNANKAFYTAQIALKSAQQTTLAVCSTPQRPAACGRAIDLLGDAAKAEAAGYTAQQTGNAADLQAALITLTALPSQLAALGILEAH
jgi:hypothetical protein